MKYEFIEKGLDEYELHYTNKNGIEVIKPFKRTVAIASKLQGGDKDARMELFTYLTSIGKTKDDFIIKKEVDGKIIYDETNYREFENSFLLSKIYEIAMQIYTELFGMDFTELLLDMGLNESNAQDFEDKIVPFSAELRDLLINGKVKTPSNSNKKQDK